MAREWCIGCFNAINEYENFEQALHGGSLNKMILHPWEFDTLSIVKFLLTLDQDMHQLLAGRCEKEIAAKMKSENYTFINPPNFDDIRETIVTRQEKESSGFLGLKKKTVTRQEKIPNPKFHQVEALLKGESFVSLNSFRMEDDSGTEYDDAYLLTEKGRIVNVKYLARYSGGYSNDITSCSEVAHNNEKANILLGNTISRFIGKDAFRAILEAGPDQARQA